MENDDSEVENTETTADFEEELPWPILDDQIFMLDDDWWNNAILSSDTDSAFYGYIEGYKLAGDYLVEKVEEIKMHQDYLVFPIGFLYRHYIELSLKRIIAFGRLLNKTNNSIDFPHHHDLSKLWQLARPMINDNFQPDPDQNALKAMDNYIDQFNSVDPGSTGAFRYHLDQKKIGP